MPGPQSVSLFFLTILATLALTSEGTATEQPNRLRVLVWNVWRGTNEVDNGPEKTLQLIKDSKADICLLQESYDIKGDRPNFGPWAAKQLGWSAWQSKSPHLCVISRYKIKKNSSTLPGTHLVLNWKITKVDPYTPLASGSITAVGLAISCVKTQRQQMPRY